MPEERPAVVEEDLDDLLLSDQPWDPSFLNTAPQDMQEILTDEFPISVLKFFKLFYSKPEFTYAYHVSRGDKGFFIKSYFFNQFHKQKCQSQNGLNIRNLA